MPYTLGQLPASQGGGSSSGRTPEAVREEALARDRRVQDEIKERNRKYRTVRNTVNIACASTGIVSGSVAYAVSKRGHAALGALLGIGAAVAYGYGALYVLARGTAFGMDVIGFLGLGGISTLAGATVGALAGRRKT